MLVLVLLVLLLCVSVVVLVVVPVIAIGSVRVALLLFLVLLVVFALWFVCDLVLYLDIARACVRARVLALVCASIRLIGMVRGSVCCCS